MSVLKDYPKSFFLKRTFFHLGNIYSIVAYFSVLNIIEPVNEISNSSLSRSGRTYKAIF